MSSLCSGMRMIGLVLALAAATAQSAPSRIVGPGAATCEVAMAPEAREKSFAYVWGVWTGMNLAMYQPVGHTSDDRGILKEVLVACVAAPAAPLAEVVASVHARFERDGR